MNRSMMMIPFLASSSEDPCRAKVEDDHAICSIFPLFGERAKIHLCLIEFRLEDRFDIHRPHRPRPVYSSSSHAKERKTLSDAPPFLLPPNYSQSNSFHPKRVAIGQTSNFAPDFDEGGGSRPGIIQNVYDMLNGNDLHLHLRSHLDFVNFHIIA